MNSKEDYTNWVTFPIWNGNPFYLKSLDAIEFNNQSDDNYSRFIVKDKDSCFYINSNYLNNGQQVAYPKEINISSLFDIQRFDEKITSIINE